MELIPVRYFSNDGKMLKEPVLARRLLLFCRSAATAVEICVRVLKARAA